MENLFGSRREIVEMLLLMWGLYGVKRVLGLTFDEEVISLFLEQDKEVEAQKLNFRAWRLYMNTLEKNPKVVRGC